LVVYLCMPIIVIAPNPPLIEKIAIATMAGMMK
jgi:hypothetical protein